MTEVNSDVHSCLQLSNVLVSNYSEFNFQIIIKNSEKSAFEKSFCIEACMVFAKSMIKLLNYYFEPWI